MLERIRSNIGRLWCILMHDTPMWPVHGRYECRTCGRHYAAFVEEGRIGTAVVSWRHVPKGIGLRAS